MKRTQLRSRRGKRPETRCQVLRYHKRRLHRWRGAIEQDNRGRISSRAGSGALIRRNTIQAYCAAESGARMAIARSRPARMRPALTVGPYLFDEHDGQAEDLDYGVELAEQTGAEVAQGAGGEEQRGDEQDAEVAAEDEHRDIARHQVHVGEHEEEGAEEQLVGNGVEVLAEGGALGEPSGEQAVEAVGEAGEDEEAEREAVVSVEDCDDQKWDDEQTREREQVGSGAELAEEIHRTGQAHRRAFWGWVPMASWVCSRRAFRLD